MALACVCLSKRLTENRCHLHSAKQTKDALTAASRAAAEVVVEIQGIPKRRVLLSLREELSSALAVGFTYRELWNTVTTSGLDIDYSYFCDILAETLGPMRHRRAITANPRPLHQHLAGIPSLDGTPNETTSLPRPSSISSSFRMTFGDDQEAREQQERLARARAKIDAELREHSTFNHKEREK